MSSIMWIVIAILIVIFLPNILSAAMNIVITLVVVAGILFALNMILKANKEKYRMQLDNQISMPSKEVATKTETDNSSSDGKMNMF